MRRALDIVISIGVLTLLLPLYVAIGLLVWLIDGLPLFHSEWRVGRGGSPFRLYKFRTMTGSPEEGPGVAASNDPRITRSGLCLKRTRLDELPQFYNILVGDMSLVGPRPLTCRHLDTLAEATADSLLERRPGLTSTVSLEFLAEDDVLAMVSNPEATYLRVLLPEKVRRELARRKYGDTVCSDLITLFQTAHCLLSPQFRRKSLEMVTRMLENDIGSAESSRDRRA